MPPDSSIGFAPADWFLAAVTAVFLLAGFIWRPSFQRAFDEFAQRTRVCMLLLFLLPIILRLLLLPHHPVPTPDIYDEFSHLLTADTLLHGRLANPPHPFHQFFETFFVLQQPTYSSIYALGLGLVLAFGRLISGIPWAGILVASGTLCAACYWMLRAWVRPNWALLGGILAVVEFGPLCQWTNSYWGGSATAAAGCLIFGALPRLRQYARPRDAVLLGLGFSLHMLTRQFESVLLFASIALFFVPSLFRSDERARLLRIIAIATAPVAPAILLILLHNHAVTQNWFTLPEKLSQYQYGVPTSLTIQPIAIPHVNLTPQQATDYRAQSVAHGPGVDSIAAFFLRLEFRVRYYRFFFLPPLYIALVAFLFALREARYRYVALTLAIFAAGTNLFPYLLLHYLAGVCCLFVLVSVIGLQQLSRLRINNIQIGPEIVRVLLVLCLAEFASWYGLHLFESPSFYPILKYETWDSVNHENPQRRIQIKRQLAAMPGQLLIFVRYTAHHVYQNEWVWNEANIDAARIVYARDLGPDEDQKLIRYYPNRRVLLLEPDANTPGLSDYKGD